MSPDSLRTRGRERERGEEPAIRELCSQSIFLLSSSFLEEKNPKV